jgi:hypothetical protein
MSTLPERRRSRKFYCAVFAPLGDVDLLLTRTGVAIADADDSPFGNSQASSADRE